LPRVRQHHTNQRSDLNSAQVGEILGEIGGNSGIDIKGVLHHRERGSLHRTRLPDEPR